MDAEEILAMALAPENTPKDLTEEDGDQPFQPDVLVEYGIEVPEDLL
jgi:hypothetical protein